MIFPLLERGSRHGCAQMERRGQEAAAGGGGGQGFCPGHPDPTRGAGPLQPRLGDLQSPAPLTGRGDSGSRRPDLLGQSTPCSLQGQSEGLRVPTICHQGDGCPSFLLQGPGSTHSARHIGPQIYFLCIFISVSVALGRKGLAFLSVETIINAEAQISPENTAPGGQIDRH